MPYRMYWEGKKNPMKKGFGPILGQVLDGIFIPFTEKQANKRLKSFALNFPSGNYRLVPTEITNEDIKELRQVHSPFISVMGFNQEYDKEEEQQMPVDIKLTGDIREVDITDAIVILFFKLPVDTQIQFLQDLIALVKAKYIN